MGSLNEEQVMVVVEALAGELDKDDVMVLCRVFSAAYGVQLRFVLAGDPGVGAGSLLSALAAEASRRAAVLAAKTAHPYAAFLGQDETSTLGSAAFSCPLGRPEFSVVDSLYNELAVRLELTALRTESLDAAAEDLTWPPPTADAVDPVPVDVIVLVAAVDTPGSLARTASYWAPALRRRLDAPYTPMVLAVTKADLPRKAHASRRNSLLDSTLASINRDAAADAPAVLVETSAASGAGVPELLDAMLFQALRPTSAAKAASDAAAAAAGSASGPASSSSDSSWASKCSIQ
ncbi:uncharacterized protein AMSG_06907 [Thecamonas trahens ATCC 50062]|uniref:Uncharacterized protein n=1 Tax=Thecamonas trahens ATCC 50062 TaxID=461836 RepID=A0A0L0DDX3_THETB|nr:hypothetical protein AMSG_06907 [Thecamonas trahens ATCC 50062]KNC50415.1 hypothetical protein AMSG_06907 [Thecamonas trahens ATCC 50062]|eukprot:XP_013756957.1 hypothetical protein AMSG_06907 [Thecamonas trahens ATCC 50062]